jgi:hypothetical protein
MIGRHRDNQHGDWEGRRVNPAPGTTKVLDNVVRPRCLHSPVTPPPLHVVVPVGIVGDGVGVAVGASLIDEYGLGRGDLCVRGEREHQSGSGAHCRRCKNGPHSRADHAERRSPLRMELAASS